MIYETTIIFYTIFLSMCTITVIVSRTICHLMQNILLYAVAVNQQWCRRDSRDKKTKKVEEKKKNREKQPAIMKKSPLLRKRISVRRCQCVNSRLAPPDRKFCKTRAREWYWDPRASLSNPQSRDDDLYTQRGWTLEFRVPLYTRPDKGCILSLKKKKKKSGGVKE